MNYAVRLLLLSIFSVLFSFISTGAIAEELDLVNRPINTSGLTGLLFTTSPYTLPTGTIEIGVSAVYENSIRPDYSITEIPLLISAGIGKNMELAIRGSYYSLKEGTTTTIGGFHSTGDIMLSYKWNFMPQTEYSNIPGVALLVTGIFPIEKNIDRKMDSVSHWGVRIGLSAGTEFSWKDHVLGIYADAQLGGQDLTEVRLRDVYEMYNAGLLFPISKYQNLQMLVEYSIVNGKDRLSLTGGDYTALMYGLRLVSERFNLTMGTQFLRKQVEGFDNTGRVIGLMSIKF